MWIFDNTKLLKDLTDDDKNQLELFCQKRLAKAWEILFKEWDPANAMYLILSWEVEVYKNINWEEKVLGILKAEDILWEMAIFWIKWKRMASARVLRDANLVTMLDFSIKQLTQSHPHILEKIKEIIEIRNIQNKSLIK